MARRKELNNLTFEILDGFGGTAAVDDPSATLTAGNTTMDIDTLSLLPSGTIVPVGARFSTASINTVRTVTATQNSTQYTLDMTAPTAGTFTVTHSGNVTGALAFDLTDTALETAIEGLASVGSGNVTVVEVADVYTITFSGTLANTVQTITVDGSSLTAVDSHVLTQVQDGTDTWSLTYTPALVAGSIPANNDVITFYPRKIEVKVGEGNIEHTKNKDPQIDLDRGVIDGARKGNEQAMDVSFAFVYDWLRSSTVDTPTADEVLEREGEAADWSNAAADECEPYQVTLKVIDAPNCGTEKAEIIIYPYFLPQTINASVEAASVSVSGVCVTTKPSVTRVVNTTYNIETTNS
jgi:hypothetical protein